MSEEAYKDIRRLYEDGNSLLLPKSGYYMLLEEFREAVAKENNTASKEFTC